MLFFSASNCKIFIRNTIYDIMILYKDIASIPINLSGEISAKILNQNTNKN